MLTAEEQADLLSEVLADYNLSYYATHGNHDHSFSLHGAPNPLVLIERNVSTFTYLPYFAADFVIGGVVRRQLHGGTGRAYALSYPGQTYMRNLLDSTGEHVYVNGKKYRLRFVQLGHYHSAMCYECAGVVVTQSGNWQFPNDYTVRRGLVGPQGGRFMDVTIEAGRVVEYKTQFVKPRRGR